MPRGTVSHALAMYGVNLTSDGRESGIVPSFDNAFLDQKLELSLRQDSINKVDSTAALSAVCRPHALTAEPT